MAAGKHDTVGKPGATQNSRHNTTIPPARPPEEQILTVTASPPGPTVAPSPPRGARIRALPEGTSQTPAAAAMGAPRQTSQPAVRERASQRGCPRLRGAPPSQAGLRLGASRPSTPAPVRRRTPHEAASHTEAST